MVKRMILLIALYSYGQLYAVEDPNTSVVEIARPVQVQWKDTIPANGWLAPWQEAVIASEIDGLKVTQINADVGDYVHKGECLARLSDETVLAEIERLNAAVLLAKAEYEQAKATADRSRLLDGTNAQSKEQYEAYLFAEKAAQAKLEEEKAALKMQKIRLDQTKILAVDDGVISGRSAHLGSVVATGTELFRLIRQRRLEWQAEIANRDINKVYIGQEVEINLPEGDAIKGHIRTISPVINKNTARTIVYVRLDTSTTEKSGQYVSGTIALGESAALILPSSAIVIRDGFSYVYSENSGKVTRVKVQTGRRVGDKVEILKGLDGNQKIVRSGAAFLTDGSDVKVANGIRP